MPWLGVTSCGADVSNTAAACLHSNAHDGLHVASDNLPYVFGTFDAYAAATVAEGPGDRAGDEGSLTATDGRASCSMRDQLMSDSPR